MNRLRTEKAAPVPGSVAEEVAEVSCSVWGTVLRYLLSKVDVCPRRAVDFIRRQKEILPKAFSCTQQERAELEISSRTGLRPVWQGSDFLEAEAECVFTCDVRLRAHQGPGVTVKLRTIPFSLFVLWERQATSRGWASHSFLAVCGGQAVHHNAGLSSGSHSRFGFVLSILLFPGMVLDVQSPSS